MSADIKLLMVTHNYPRFEGDFAGIFISLLAKRLGEHGITPVVLAPHAPGAKEFEEMDGVRVYRFRYAERDEDENLAYQGSMHKLVLGSVSGIFRFKHFLDCFRRATEDVIVREQVNALAGHWLVPSGMVLKTINRRRKLPVFMYSHGTDVRLAKRYFKAIYRYMADFCQALHSWTVVSSYLKNELAAMDRRLENILEVLPVPHDESIFYKDDSVATDDNLVVAVTRFTRQKRVEYLIRAFALVVEKNSEARLEIYGGGVLQGDIEGLIDKLGLKSNVTIRPPVTQRELRTIYNRAAMVVLNSYEEGFGLALSEAMLCGTAVIGADSGGISDIIEHRQRGLLVRPDDSAALAEAIGRYLSDKELRDSMASAGLRFAGENYTSAALAARYADIVRSAFVK